MSDHTPGPWTAYEYADDWYVDNATDDSGPMLCVGSWHDDREANARLIAAAPELLEALKQFPENPNPYTYRLAYQKACAAIAKATGGAT